MSFPRSLSDTPTVSFLGVVGYFRLLLFDVYYRDYELVILQQPEVGAETGLEKMTLGRVSAFELPECVGELTSF